MKAHFIFLLCFFCAKISTAQLTAAFDTTLNTNCLGQPCDYEGPTILINELMITPAVGDGSISGPSSIGAGRGEWIELYNPNLCEPVDISCYYLGNSTNEGGGGVRLPDNLIVPPGGFVMVRGVNVTPVPSDLLVENSGNVIEVVVPENVTDDGVCLSGFGNRVWFPNAGGWFAFYSEDGTPQDAVSWGNQNSIGSPPCSAVSFDCPFTDALASYNDIPIDRKEFAGGTPPTEQTIRRIPDGGAWSGAGAATYATCNSLPCATVGESTCTGTATVNVTGGQAPYNYLWNDSQLQMTQTATGLCAGTYEVLVTDANGIQATFEVEIEDFVPTVTLDVAAEYCVYDDSVSLVNFAPVAGIDQIGELVGPGVDSLFFLPSDAGVGTHTLTYTFTDENGCTSFAEDQITVHPIPDLSMNIAAEYCTYDSPDLITNLSPSTSGPEGTGVVSGPGISNTGLNTTFFTPEVAGVGTHIITYTFTSIHGCVNSVTDEIVVHEAPVVNFSANPIEGFEPLLVDFTNNSTGSNNYNWDFGDDNVLSSDATDLQHIFEEFGSYTVVLTGESNGCFDSDSLVITVNINPITYDIPNVFSPNGDESNPLWMLINPSGFHRIEEFEVLILNRWGNVMRVFNDPLFTWDGKTDNGMDAPEGVYYYKLYMTSLMGDIFEEHGFFHLLR